jgi:hypothetical protein
MIYIIAGTYDEYCRFRDELCEVMRNEGISFNYLNIRYVHHPEQLNGLSDIWGYKVGTWRERKDISKLEEMLLVRRSNLDEFIEVDWK